MRSFKWVPLTPGGTLDNLPAYGGYLYEITSLYLTLPTPSLGCCPTSGYYPFPFLHTDTHTHSRNVMASGTLGPQRMMTILVVGLCACTCMCLASPASPTRP